MKRDEIILRLSDRDAQKCHDYIGLFWELNRFRWAQRLCKQLAEKLIKKSITKPKKQR